MKPKKSRILVTGATGFIGSSLCARLTERGYDVYGLVRLRSGAWNLPRGVKAVAGDLTDPYAVHRAVEAVRPQAVFHLGAVTPVSESFSQPRHYMEVNYGGTVNMAEACLSLEDLRLFAYASTSEVYGNQDSFPLREEYTPRPNTPYAVAKRAAEAYLLHYMREAYEFPVVAARPFNTYGRAAVNQPHYVVEKIVTSMLRGDKYIQLGAPDAMRDLVFREDHVAGYLSLLDAAERGEDIYGEAYNFATGKSYTIKEVLIMIADMLGWQGSIQWGIYTRPADIARLEGDYSKARRTLGWQPKYSLEDGLEKTIQEWREVLP